MLDEEGDESPEGSANGGNGDEGPAGGMDDGDGDVGPGGDVDDGEGDEGGQGVLVVPVDRHHGLPSQLACETPRPPSRSSAAQPPRSFTSPSDMLTHGRTNGRTDGRALFLSHFLCPSLCSFSESVCLSVSCTHT